MSTVCRNRFHRICSIITTIMMALTIFATIPFIKGSNVFGTGETGQVTASLLNVRSGAGTGYSKIGSLAKGKTFTVTGEARDSSGVVWYRLNYNSKTGYVSSKYVDIKQPTVTSVTNLNGTVNTVNDPLIVRSGPGKNFGKIGTIAKGKTFSINGKAQDSSGTWWYKFSFNGGDGFVSSSYVKTTSTASSVTQVSNSTGTVVTKNDPLTVRSGPGTSYSKLGSLAKGKTFDIIGKAQDSSGTWWYQFSYNGKTAYASSKYVAVTEKPQQPQQTEQQSPSGENSENTVQPEQKKIGTVNTVTDPLIIRSGPGKNYSNIGTIPKGKNFDVIAEEKDSSGLLWYKLTYNGKTGFVSSAYVVIKETDNDSEESNVVQTPVEAKPVTFQMGTTTADSGLNVRSGAGTGYSVMTVLPKGSAVTIVGSSKASNGTLWYHYNYSESKLGYICSDYVKVETVTSDSEFEAYMIAQGFPESYKAGLRALHVKHPQWVFKAKNMDYTWDQALTKQKAKQSANLVSPSSPVSYRDPDSYNSSTKSWYRPDSGWYVASKSVVAHYMDPRNFLNESGIYQFMTHKYDSGSQNANTVSAVIAGSFMQSKNPGGGYSSYAALINDAGKNSGVNPNVLASMIIQEQGWSGSSLVSGTYSGYAGYYNFFNIGAYQTDSMNAVQRGLWYASCSDASEYRPWNTPYKSILGGAKFYADGYVNQNQYTYYTKRFNVNNGLSSIGTHQYMTNVAGAASEGSIVKRAYANNSNYPIVFEIPVYKSMPSSPCPLQ